MLLKRLPMTGREKIIEIDLNLLTKSWHRRRVLRRSVLSKFQIWNQHHLLLLLKLKNLSKLQESEVQQSPCSPLETMSVQWTPRFIMAANKESACQAQTKYLEEPELLKQCPVARSAQRSCSQQQIVIQAKTLTQLILVNLANPQGLGHNPCGTHQGARSSRRIEMFRQLIEGQGRCRQFSQAEQEHHKQMRRIQLGSRLC